MGPSLEAFGQLLMQRVRDEAISDWDMIVSGRMKDLESQEIAGRPKGFAPEQLRLLEVGGNLAQRVWRAGNRERARKLQKMHPPRFERKLSSMATAISIDRTSLAALCLRDRVLATAQVEYSPCEGDHDGAI